MANILIVEDDQALNDAYVMILERASHKVAKAFNGKEALAEVKKQDPDIILLDLLMPEMDGLTFLQKYNLKQDHPKVSVVILSNLGNDKEIAKAMELGAYKYIIKAHATPDELSALVNHLIEKNLRT